MLRDATSRCWSVSRNRTTRGGPGRRPPRLRDYENEDRILKKLEIQTIQPDKETEEMKTTLAKTKGCVGGDKTTANACVGGEVLWSHQNCIIGKSRTCIEGGFYAEACFLWRCYRWWFWKPEPKCW